MSQIIQLQEIRHFHFYCGSGGGAKGFNKASARVGNLVAHMRCIGGIDNDPASIRDFSRVAKVPGTVIDLFSEQQYRDFHGHAPPAGWRPATADDVRRAAGYEFPHIVFLSPPCKGLSGLLAESLSLSAKYQALNRLTVRGIKLMLEAFGDDLPELIILENVPRIATRGRSLVDEIKALLDAWDFATAETTHDCGELGGLGQSRKRFLLVARNRAKVAPFLYEPPKKRLKGVGEILERLPLPGDIERAGPMHRVPSLQWKTWVRLAFVEAGQDWRSLNRLAVDEGVLRDFGILPDRAWRDGTLGVLPWEGSAGAITAQAEATTGRFSVADPRAASSREGSGFLGVNEWTGPSGTVTANGRPGAGAFSVADPRATQPNQTFSQYGVQPWGHHAATVTSQTSPGGGPNSVADPRVGADGPRFNNVYRIVAWDAASPAVTGGGGNSAGAVADPRGALGRHVNGKYRVTSYDEPANTVIAGSTTGNGAFVVADPRPTHGVNAHQNKMAVVSYDAPCKTVTGSDRVGSGALSVADPRPRALSADDRSAYQTGGHYGVVSWGQASGAVPASAKNNNDPWSVADPRAAGGDVTFALPKPEDRLVCVIRALDGTWHRPFTTLELAALQSYVDPDELHADFALDGKSDSSWRERIGNMVPPDAAEAVGSEMARTLLLAWSGETFALSSTPIWVQPIATAIALDVPKSELGW